MKKLGNIFIRFIQMICLLFIGCLALILYPISILVDGVKKEIIQDLPPDEDEEFSERWRRLIWLPKKRKLYYGIRKGR